MLLYSLCRGVSVNGDTTGCVHLSLWPGINSRNGRVCNSFCIRVNLFVIENGFKNPQGLSTLLFFVFIAVVFSVCFWFDRWSERPLRGGVRDDSP